MLKAKWAVLRNVAVAVWMLLVLWQLFAIRGNVDRLDVGSIKRDVRSIQSDVSSIRWDVSSIQSDVSDIESYGITINR